MLLRLFCSIYTKYTNVFFFQGRFKVLKLQYFKHLCRRHIKNLLKHLKWSFCWKALSLFKKRFILDIWVLNTSLIIIIDCNLFCCCITLKIRLPILFHFQRRINVISTVIHDVETKLIRRWNWLGSIYEKVNSYGYSACNFTNILKLVGIF